MRVTVTEKLFTAGGYQSLLWLNATPFRVSEQSPKYLTTFLVCSYSEILLLLLTLLLLLLLIITCPIQLRNLKAAAATPAAAVAAAAAGM